MGVDNTDEVPAETAPSFIASTAVSTVPWAVNSNVMTSAPCDCKARNNPRPSSLGMTRSEMTIAGRKDVTFSSASSPSVAESAIIACVWVPRDEVTALVIPDADARELRAQGVAEIFGPGSSLKGISAWLEAALDSKEN